MKKEKRQGKCKNKAEAIAPWAGKIIKGCNKHIRGLIILGQVMGETIEARSLPPTHDLCEFVDD